ncbi:MAG: hypothetical protein HFH79_10960 [Lachnospiraceae bacterium]|jgi:hypothetical protein|nr:hypothetical protein C804_01718 [Lachnospiraceae bacterium A4]MCI8974088.1 hypothetical protein [Lachnospiraceae bacterium]
MIPQAKHTQELFSIIIQHNSVQEIRETIKLFMDSMKDTTLNTLLMKDSDYQTCQQEYLRAYECYQNDDFSTAQRDTVDSMLAQIDECHLAYATNAYFAGLIDSYRIIKSMES